LNYVAAAEMRRVRRNDLSLFIVPFLALLSAWWPYSVRTMVVNGMHWFVQKFIFVF